MVASGATRPRILAGFSSKAGQLPLLTSGQGRVSASPLGQMPLKHHSEAWISPLHA